MTNDQGKTATTEISYEELDQYVKHGKQLQSAAVRNMFYSIFSITYSGLSSLAHKIMGRVMEPGSPRTHSFPRQTRSVG